MCGIVGYIGKRNALPVVIDGLKKLEYRGYDSAGVALWNGKKMYAKKTAGRVAELERLLNGKAMKGSAAIAHTRWATHGKPSSKNAHPHYDCAGDIFVVHNGIIENYAELKEALQREGHTFRSDTDTEVLAHLIERPYLLSHKKLSLEDAVLEAFRHVRGAFGVAVMARWDGGKIIAARRGSPLIVGVGEREYVVASDASAIVGLTRNVIYLRDNECALLTPQKFEIFSATGGSKKTLKKSIDTVSWDIEDAQKGGFAHFMQKEIFEGPDAVRNSIRGRLLKNGLVKLGGLEDVKDRLFGIKRMSIVACGTSYYAGLLGRYFFENLARIPVSVEHASEFRYRSPVVDKETAVIAISQSGETADTLFALREAKKQGALTLGVVNAVGSSIARETHAGVYNHAGPEIGVASTKAFISQIAVLMQMALFLRQRDGRAPSREVKDIVRELKILPARMEYILRQDKKIKDLARRYARFEKFSFVGRRYHYPVALEGALKLKEISYRFAEGNAMGELKHGPLALIDKNFPSIFIALKDSLYEKVLSNIQEVRARSGPVIALATEGDEEIKKYVNHVIFIPSTIDMLSPLLAIIPLQLFAYHTADLLGHDVDKPRNLAKSVTVE